MSRRRTGDPVADFVGDLAAGMLAAGTVAVLAGIVIAELLRTPVEEKLRLLTPAETWGTRITARRCRHCRMQTEAQASLCHSCGRRLQ